MRALSAMVVTVFIVSSCYVSASAEEQGSDTTGVGDGAAETYEFTLNPDRIEATASDPYERTGPARHGDITLKRGVQDDDTDTETQIDPPSLNLDAGPADAEIDTMSEDDLSSGHEAAHVIQQRRGVPTSSETRGWDPESKEVIEGTSEE